MVKYVPRVANVKKNFQPFTAELRTLIHKKTPIMESLDFF